MDPKSRLDAAVAAFRDSSDFHAWLASVDDIARDADVDQLASAVEEYRLIPEVAGPVYEYVVAARPEDARALVTLANAYWLTGRGPDAVQDLATRAMAADPDNRGAWHLWALSEAEPRERMMRWRQVSERFPQDDLARATLADSAASLASAERDREAHQIALRAYRQLLATAEHPEQRDALRKAVDVLEGWNL